MNKMVIIVVYLTREVYRIGKPWHKRKKENKLISIKQIK